jgi:hypothetical protein
MPQGKVIGFGRRVQRDIFSVSDTKISIWMRYTDNMDSMWRRLLEAPLFPMPKSILRGGDLPVWVTAEKLVTVCPGRNCHMTMTHLDKSKDLPSLKNGAKTQLTKGIAADLAVKGGVPDEAKLARSKLELPYRGFPELCGGKLDTAITIDSSLAL